jgi:RimJ/RimL family protein N-acetyltransferase
MQHKGKVIKEGGLTLQPFTVDLQPYSEIIIESLISIFSNKEVIKYNRNLKINSVEDGKVKLYKILDSYQEETSYTYFLLDDLTKNVLGVITIISPKGISELYPFFNKDKVVVQTVELSKAWVIEFYLNPIYWGKGLIPFFANKLIEQLKLQGAKSMLAFTEHENINSIKVLKKIGFTPIHKHVTGDYRVMVKHLKPNFLSFFQ